MTYILTGDCLAVMPTLEAESVDAIVSDPPYGLAFMGKAWDHGVPGPEFWREAWRVAKPGAHLVAFGGTRTYHRLTCAIEDAGWEIRDCLSWLYGSGFPKSLDVSKAMDKMDAAEEQMARRYRFTAWVRESGITIETMWSCLMPFVKNEATAKAMAQHYVSTGKQPAIMTLEHLDAVRHLIGEVPKWVERECAIRSVESKNFAEREVVGHRRQRGSPDGVAPFNTASAPVELITAPATALAREWQGWGTAIKPAWEPIILARKPLTGTVASNVAQHGTGALNVDGCRIAGAKHTQSTSHAGGQHGRYSYLPARGPQVDDGKGRWPANVCLDEEAATMLDAQTGEQKSGVAVRSRSGGNTFGGDSPKPPMDNIGYGDSGGASRFFYVAKASRREREAGLEGMPEKRGAITSNGGVEGRLMTVGAASLKGEPTEPPASRNHHPTVKPIALMRWLCRLVTPKGGLILDPFTGSGTTGCAAVLEGFRFVGIEREPEYAAIAEKRIAHWAGQVDKPTLFG